MRRLFNNCKKTLAIFLSAFMAFSGTGLNVPVAMAQEAEVIDLEGFEIVNKLEGQPSVTANPTLSGTYGTAVEDMTLTDGTVMFGEVEITGTWSITDANKSDKPQVGTTDEYEVTFTPDSSYNGNYDAKTVKVVPEVTAKSLSSSDVTITEVTDTFTYDGREKEPSVTVSDETATITDADYENSYENNINAYTLTSADAGFDNTKAPTVKITGKGNYTGTIYRYFTISKATVEAVNPDIQDEKEDLFCFEVGGNGTWDIKSLMPRYAGTLSFTVGTKTDENSILNVAMDSDNEGVLRYTVSTGAIGNSASVPVTVSSDNYEDITFTLSVSLVDKQSVTVDMSGISLVDKVYDGNAVAYTGAAIGKIGNTDVDYTGAFTYKWYESKIVTEPTEHEVLTELTGAPTKTGNYVLKAIVSTLGYQGEGSKNVTISKANPEYTAPTGLTATYGDTLADVALPTGFSWESDGNSLVGDVGNNSFSVKFTPSDTDNYNVVTGISVTINVLPRKLDAQGVTITEVTDTFTYDGNEKKPTVTVSDSGAAITTDDYEISYLNNVNAYIFTDVGGVTGYTNAPTVKITGKGNYTGTIYRYFTINKALVIAVNPDIQDEKEDSFCFEVGGNGTWDIKSLMPRDAGTLSFTVGTKTDENSILNVAMDSDNEGVLRYTVSTGAIGNSASVPVTVSSDNYEDITFTLSVSLVDKQSVTVDMSGISLVDKVYDGNAVAYTGAASGKIGNTDVDYTGAFTYKWYESKVVTEPTEHEVLTELTGAPTKTGNYVLKAIVSTLGYQGEGSKNVTISKANPEYTAPTGLTATYGDTLADVALPTGFSWESDGNSLVGDVGNNSFNLKFTPSDIENYNVVTGIPVTIAVSPRSLEASGVNIAQVTETFTYDGNEKIPTVMVNDQGATITAADYEISYFNNKNAYTFKATDAGFDATKSPTVKITGKGNYEGTIYRYFTIDKKSLANPGKINHSYIYSTGSKNETITVDLAALLPVDRGQTAYNLQSCDAAYVVDEAVSSDGKLTYKVDKSGNISDTTDLIVNITTDNYTDIVATVNILLVDKNVTVQKASLPVKITGNTVLTYGDTVDKLTLNKQDAVFVIEGTDTVVSGTLSWENPKLVPTVGTIKADWVFTPDLPDEYKTCRGNVAMSVVKANPIVKTPTADAITYNPGVSLSMLPILGENGNWKLDGADTEVAGKWSWKEAGKVPVVDNSGYVVVFTPDDTNNYNKIEKTVSIKVNKANPYIAVLPRSTAITYGDNLDKAILSGGTVIYNKDSSVIAYNSEVKGEFKWKDGSIKPSVLDSYKTKYTLVFTPFDKDNYHSCETEITLKVDKRAAKTFETETREFVYTVGSDRDQVVDIASMLPGDCGKVAYRVSKSGVVSWANVTNGKLSYRVIPGMKDQEGSVNVTVVSDNYQNHNYTIKVKLVDKETVSLKEGCNLEIADENLEFIYGDKLSKLSLVQADGKKVAFVADNSGEVVEGTVKWSNPDYTPTVSEKNAMWKFVPKDTSRYMECTGYVDINVIKATPGVSEIQVLDVTYNPSVLLMDIKPSAKGTHKVGDTVVTVTGSLLWKKPNEVPRTDKQEYDAVFVPDNQDDYNVSDCVVKVKVKKAVPKITILPEASDITYTELLGDSKISGGEVRYSDDSSVVGYDVLVDGAFAWANKMFAPSVSDSGVTKFDVIFTPSDTVNYDVVKTGITLNVDKIENAPNMPIDIMNVGFAVGKKVSDVSLEAYEGWEWSEDYKDILLTSDENGVVAVAKYIDWDKGNYSNITKNVTIYMEQCNHKGGHATCIKRAVCNICKQEYGGINPDNHENVELKNMVAATCVTDGYTGDLCCTDCGGVLAQGENIRATGHDYMISLEIPATTIKEGLRTYTCTVCGDSYSEDIPKIPTDDNPNSSDIIAKGVFVAEKTENSILAGMVVETANMEEVEYSWWVSRDGGERWSLIQGWTKGYEWLSWDPRGYGDYMIMGKARLAGKTTVVEASLQATFHPAIKGICQMPYTGDGGGYLIGIESVDNGSNKYQYEMLILDCSLLAEGKDAWIYTTGKCGAEGNCLWTIWQPQYGYYWTLFRIYDNTGVLVDEMCYGFANAC